MLLGRRLAVFLMTVATIASTIAPSLLLPPERAEAFGTIRGLGQRAEHELVTRIALACPAGTPSNGDCFEPESLDQLAGKEGTFGAVGAPDSDDQIFDPAAHCDDADFLDSPGYPQSRAEATRALQACVDHLRAEFAEGVDDADDLLDDEDGTLIIEAHEVIISPDCVFTGGVPGRAKCNVLQGFGRALHGIQDFYAHSNWADEADASRPIGIDNPPGLNLPAPSPVLDLRGRGPISVPQALSSGFFKGGLPGQDVCPGVDGRITHACLNKDKMQIEPGGGVTVNGAAVPGLGNVSDPQTDRGKVGQNALKAVAGAVVETRRQWADFRVALGAKYGPERAGLIIAALTQDRPQTGDGLIPNIPGIPDVPVIPDIPGIPSLTGPQGAPGVPGVPANPGAPANPNAPPPPSIPGIPNIPNLPGLPRP